MPQTWGTGNRCSRAFRPIKQTIWEALQNDSASRRQLLPALFPGHLSTVGGGGGAFGGGRHLTPVRKPFLKELGSFGSRAHGSEIRRRLEGRRGGHLRHPPSPPNPFATGSLTQEALEARYLLLINEKGIPRAAGLMGCSSDATNHTLDVYQAISHNCHYGSVGAEHPRCKKKKKKNMHAAGRDGCLEMASMYSGSLAALLSPTRKLC